MPTRNPIEINCEVEAPIASPSLKSNRAERTLQVQIGSKSLSCVNQSSSPDLLSPSSDLGEVSSARQFVPNGVR
jgi:hypothetical protein